MNLAVFPGTYLSSLFGVSQLSAALQRVSRAECLESMAYKNRAVNPLTKKF